MGTPRILSTETAKEKLREFRRVIDEDLTRDLGVLRAAGTILSDPDHWDGTKAAQYRSIWDEIELSTKKLQDALAKYQHNAQSINNDIWNAGS